MRVAEAELGLQEGGDGGPVSWPEHGVCEPISHRFVLLFSMNITLSVCSRVDGIKEGRQSQPPARAVTCLVGGGLVMTVVCPKSACGCPDLSSAHLR